VDWKLGNTYTITLNLTLCLEAVEVGHNVFGETVFLGDENDLTTGELEARSSKGLSCVFNVLGFSSNGHKNLIDTNTCSLDVWLTESATHTLLKSIGSSAGKHFVDTDGVPWVNTYAHVESILTSLGDHVFVGSNTG
jgi:hypothetical protein